MRIISAILIGNIILLQSSDASAAPSSIECVLKPIDIIEDTGFEFPGPIRTLQYSELTPIEGLEPIGSRMFGNDLEGHNIYTVDLNGDQLQDIVTHLDGPDLEAGPAPPTPIQILFNTGDGALVDCTRELILGDIPTMWLTRDIHVADFNGDQLPDIFFSNHGTEAIQPFPCEQNRLLLSNHEGKLADVTFTNLPQVLDFSHGSSVADVDLDGDVDIYVNNLGCETNIGSYLMQNDGNGAFSIVAGGEPTIGAFFVHEGPAWSSFLDYDKDGDQDLFAARVNLLSESNEVTVANLILINDGQGNFTENHAVTLPPPVNRCPDSDRLSLAQDVWINDMDHDGWPDIVVYYAACDTPIVQLLINDTEGGFVDQTVLRIPSHETAVFGSPTFTVADVDGNRSPDIVFEQHQADASVTPYYFFNDGTGSFVREVPKSGTQYLGSLMTPIDLNRDGVMDQAGIACTNYGQDGCLERKWYKRIIQALPTQEPGIQINAGHSGAWYNPETPGQGGLIDITPASQFLFLSWFTFTEGVTGESGESHWFTAQGNYWGNTAELIVYETTGGQFDDTQAVNTQPIGAASLAFSDCANGLLHYRLDNWDRQGSIRLKRAIPGSENVCEQLNTKEVESVAVTQVIDINAGMDGAWYNPATAGQGLLVDVFPNPEGNDFMFMAWFTFGDDTFSGLRWLTAQGTYEGSTADLDVYETVGGLFDKPSETQISKVGTATIDYEDCSNARLSYFLEKESKQGEIELTRALPGGEALCEEIARAD